MTATASSVINWASPSATRALAWALLHFLWQGSALAALAAAAMALVRRASLRYLLGVATLVFMLAAPIATFVFYFQQPYDQTAARTAVARSAMELRAKAAATTRPVSTSPTAPSTDALPWLVEAWLVGVAFFSLRTAGGFLLIERQRRREATALSPRLLAMCHELQLRLGLTRTIAYCEGM